VAVVIPGSGDIRWDEAAVDDLLHDPAGPVGQFIAGLDEIAAQTARRTVHEFPGTSRSTVWNPATSTAVLPPGTTRDSIRVHGPVRGSRGGLYGGVNAMLVPGLFLDFPPKGAVQMYDRYPFLTTGLDAVEAALS
jgi:hypothetical protein